MNGSESLQNDQSAAAEDTLRRAVDATPAFIHTARPDGYLDYFSFSIVFLMPHMETIASLVVLVACASAIAGWVAAGSERISYAGLQLASAFFYSVFQGYAPDTDSIPSAIASLESFLV
jgi:hypothetical protein